MEYVKVFITIGFFSGVIGDCPLNSPNILVSSCDGTTKSGITVYIDFKQINKPCKCFVTTAFDGDLVVRADVAVYPCDTIVRVDNSFSFPCLKQTESTIVKVRISHPVKLEADYKQQSSRRGFHHCLQFFENAGGNGQVYVTCGETATSTYKTTITSSTPGDASSKIPSITTNLKDETTTSENALAISTHNIFNNSHDSPKALTEDEPNYTILGIAAGGGLIFVAAFIIIIVIFLSRHRRRNKNESKIPKRRFTTEHTNDGYKYDHDLPDNPLYHSSQLANEVGYSTVEDQKPGPPAPPMNDSDQTPNIYDTPVKREMTNGRDTKQEQPVYAIPKKIKSNPINSTGGDMYAQVNKPNTNSKNSPVRTQNQEGLVYMEVDHSRDTKTENSPYTNDYDSETVTYAEVKTK